MKRIYTSDNFMLAGQIKSLLETNHIDCFMKNECLTGGIGELPPIECWPEVWIRNEADEIKANTIITSIISSNPGLTPSWECICGETIEGQFSQCWNCGHNNT